MTDATYTLESGGKMSPRTPASGSSYKTENRGEEFHLKGGMVSVSHTTHFELQLWTDKRSFTL